MGLFNRKRQPVPAELQTLIPRQQKLLAWGQTTTGYCAVTDVAWISTGESLTVIPWQLAVSAKWDEPRLTIVAQANPSAPALSHHFTVTESGNIPLAVHDRVMDAQVYERTVELNCGLVQFLARRSSDDIMWTAIPMSPHHSATTESDQEIAVALAELRSQLGI